MKLLLAALFSGFASLASAQSAPVPLPLAEGCRSAECITALDAIDQQLAKADAAIDVEMKANAQAIIKDHGKQCGAVLSFGFVDLPNSAYTAVKIACLNWPKIDTLVLTIPPDASGATITEISSTPAR